MMPKGPDKLTLSQMNFMGMGPKMIKHVIKKHNAMTVAQILELAQEQNINLVACNLMPICSSSISNNESRHYLI